MSKTIDTVSHIKNKILLATYIFRSLPMDYIQKTVANPKERQKIRNTIVFLKRDQYLLQKKTLQGQVFLYISKKGYQYITEKLLNNEDDKTLYKYKEDRSLRKNISEHSFMNFMYIWHYISTYPEQMTKAIKIYEDTNMNQCKVRTYFDNKTVIVSPDVIIYSPISASSIFQNALFIENDTGRETYKTIYQKLVEYAVLIEKGLASNKIEKLTIHFIIRTQKRVDQLFYGPNGIVKFFNAYNNTIQIKDVRARTIIQAFNNPKVKIFISAFDHNTLSNPYMFKEYKLVELLLKEKPTWNIYL